MSDPVQPNPSDEPRWRLDREQHGAWQLISPSGAHAGWVYTSSLAEFSVLLARVSAPTPDHDGLPGWHMDIWLPGTDAEAYAEWFDALAGTIMGIADDELGIDAHISARFEPAGVGGVPPANTAVSQGSGETAGFPLTAEPQPGDRK